jgi:hypothetical protein
MTAFPLPVRIAATPGHPWHHPCARRVEVHVNGRRLPDCVRADTQAGYAWAHVRDAQGELLREYGRLVERLHIGVVELRPITPNAVRLPHAENDR